ncbi:TetR/AcrR family transcriptional regulator [Actinokineospora globicatena]|uniref:TetR/AcrR family transcriptional regulator n=1 Tax=Actinokineospora globicatena TaxID=103729 RepID=UPI0020A2B0BC|nr:TetR/AcrR family transcriptional regulator [Actinokineospora globicatena]MCP2304611.1 transcriptional regulator, TetR family [Actinokineospora globicatena]GLW78017.1 TetR family transcriptional regulator [Actinokineospora globicatena]GLW85317.1 TetR family transcriptional regulator [Actinokineospora globicatena]
MTRPSRTTATKRKLFDATLRLAGTRGMVGLTVDDIAAEAGVAKGTVYYNFGSKDGLVDALLRHGVDLLATRLRSVSGSAADTLTALVEGMLGFFAEYPTFAQLLVSELWRTPGQWQQTLTLLREEVTSIIRGQLQRLADSGELPAGVRVATASSALFGTVLVVSLDWLVFSPDQTLPEVRDSVLSLVRGLRTP